MQSRSDTVTRRALKVPACATTPSVMPDGQWLDHEAGHEGNRVKKVALIGTYPPRRCGIATFTFDLADAISTVAPHIACSVLSINDQLPGEHYPDRVSFEINQDELADYCVAADYLNVTDIDLVCLQHEYGIFGGPDGRYILELLRRLRVPTVTTLHTVLSNPTEGQHRTLQQIARLSYRLIVMAKQAAEFLRDVYQVPTEKIVHIPHGIPDVPFVEPNRNKKQLGVADKKVMLTFGLLSPSKGIETMIDALPQITQAHPDVVYIVLGATHPSVRTASGEGYRTRLQRRARDKGVAENVIFHNRFIGIEELCQFLVAADVYVTPYLNEAQVVSGTLAYALGTGNAVVSTPYWYAQEMLADAHGCLVPFRDHRSLATTVINLLDDGTYRRAMASRAYAFTRAMTWPQVGRRYVDLFADVVDRGRRSTARAPVPRSADHEGEVVRISP